ncbi:MAG: hypothetical protein ACE5DX_06150 [Candidatus Dojkabacteria bacterium]
MKSFSFNLLPEKPKEIQIKEEGRDRSAVYTAILPLFAVILWLGLVLFNGLVVNAVRDNWQSAVDQKNARIDSEFLATLTQHGELVKKTQALARVIVKDIKPEELFILTEILFPVPESDVLINGYGRDRDGSFNVTITTDTYLKFAEITRRFNNYEGIRDVNIKNISLDEDSELNEGIINFNFVDESLVSGTGSGGVTIIDTSN